MSALGNLTQHGKTLVYRENFPQNRARVDKKGAHPLVVVVGWTPSGADKKPSVWNYYYDVHHTTTPAGSDGGVVSRFDRVK